MPESTSFTLKELAELVSAELRGDPNCVINAVAPLDRAQQNQISFLANAEFRPLLANTKAAAIILNAKDAALTQSNVLIINDPHLAYAKIAAALYPAKKPAAIIHPSAVIGKDCVIAANVSIGAQCVIGERVIIAANTIVYPGCIIGDDSEIGEASVLNARVTLYDQIKIGKRAIIHSGVVIGADGFGMANECGKWVKVPQLGRVIIGDDVEIGANTTIDRGALDDTVIAEGVKLDNLIQIAHNVQIGAHTAIAACTTIAGSTHIGKHCMIGGGTTIVGHIEIVDQVILVGTSVVERSITEPGVYGSGTGLMPFQELKRMLVRIRQLDEMAKRLRKLEKTQNVDNGH